MKPLKFIRLENICVVNTTHSCVELFVYIMFLKLSCLYTTRLFLFCYWFCVTDILFCIGLICPSPDVEILKFVKSFSPRIFLEIILTNEI